jgi:Beta-propeller repeat
MKLSFGLCITFAASSLLAANAPPNAVQLLARSALRFEPLPGAGSGRFLARGAHFAFEFSARQAIFHAAGKNVRLQFERAAARARIEGDQRLPSKTNIFTGNDPSKWRTGVPNYRRLSVRGLYPGVDLSYYGNAGELEYDLIVRPGASPAQIRLRVESAHATLGADGSLISDVIQRRPFAYQTGADGKRIPVQSRYRANSDGSYSFALGPYDRARELVIDPVLSLAQYLGGALEDIAYGIGHDSNGLIYVAGTTYSADFVAAGTPFQAAAAGGRDLFLAVIDPRMDPSSQIIYTTYVGGTGDETFGGMSVGPQGDVYITGATASTDFPTFNPAQSTLGSTTGTNAIILWFDRFQTLLYSSYLGGTTGTEIGRAIAADAQGRLWVTGTTTSDDFPNVSGMQVYGGLGDMFVAGIDPSQSGSATLIYATYLGGTGWDNGRGIAVAADGTVWVAGGTSSTDINIIGPCFQCASIGQGDGYVAHINPSYGADALLFATYLGGTNLDEARNILLDPAGRVIVDGYTLSSDFPITSNAPQQQFGGNTDAFVSVFDPSITSTTRSSQFVYSTYFGGGDVDVPFDMKQDASGNLYVAGFTLSSGLPTNAQSLQAQYDGTMDAFALKLALPSSAAAGGISYFTYLGSDGVQVAYGVDFDSQGDLYLAGFTSGPIFDALGGPGKGTSSGNVDAFVMGIGGTTSLLRSGAFRPVHRLGSQRRPTE